MARQVEAVLEEILERLRNLEHQAELMKTVLIVKEPNTVPAAQSYDGLRKQIVAAAAERRSHLAQLVTMSVAVSRAASVDDLRPQLTEWMEQAGVAVVADLPPGMAVDELFEDVTGAGLTGLVEILEPAYVDRETSALLRLGRARQAQPQRVSERDERAARESRWAPTRRTPRDTPPTIDPSNEPARDTEPGEE